MLFVAAIGEFERPIVKVFGRICVLQGIGCCLAPVAATIDMNYAWPFTFHCSDFTFLGWALPARY